MRRVLSCVLLLLPVWAAAQDAEEDSLSMLHAHDISTHIVIGRYESNAPIARSLDLSYIRKDALLQHQGNSFVHTLERLPGFRALQTGVGIAKPVIRGLSLNRVVVNEYGIKQEGQQWGLDHGLEIDQFGVERVELIKGPVSVMYGSDGLGGVINILPPIVSAADTIRGELIGSYKSNNDLLGLSAKLQYSKSGWYNLIRFSYQDFAAYRVPADSFTYNGYQLPIYRHRLQNTGGREAGVSWLSGIRKPWGNTQLYLSHYHQKAGFFVGAIGIPRAWQLSPDVDARAVALPYQNINHTKLLSNTLLLLPQGKLELDLGLQYNARAEHSPAHAHGLEPAPQGDEALSLDLYTLSGNLKYSSKGGAWQRSHGLQGQWQSNRRGGYEFLLPSYTAFQLGLYHFSAYQLNNNWLLNAGVRADYARQYAAAAYVTQYDSAGAPVGERQRSPEIDRDYFNLSGSVGAFWQPTELWHFKLNAGSAYRIPALVELTANGVHHGTFRHEMGDAQLKPERAYMIDATAHVDWQNMSMQWTPFAHYFEQYIYLSPSARFSPLPDAGQVYQYKGAEAVFFGSEFIWNWKLNTQWHSNLAAEYVWNQNLSSGMPLPFTPPFSLREEIIWQPSIRSSRWWNNVQLALNGQYFAAQRRVDRNEAPTEGYFLLNLSAQNSFLIGKQKLSLYLQLRNITNTVYQNNVSRYRILNLPEQGFSTQLMLRWEW